MDKNTQEKVEEAANFLRGAAKPVFDIFLFCLPHVINGVRTAYAFWMKLPQNAISFIYGFVFCFFGGTFPVLFAALQAMEHGGREKVMESLQVLADQARIVIEESKKDDDEDKDQDGVQDVRQISNADYLKRKTLLVLRKMDPHKVDDAIAATYKVWISVVAVLSVEFAKTVSMALSIADFLKKPCDRFITPMLQRLIPVEYNKWIPITLNWITNLMAMSLAWYVQSLISATASALKGGLMMARAIYLALLHYKINLFGLLPENHQSSNLDEIMAYGFAALGVYSQIKMGFSLPAPLNIILFPFQMAEQYIRYTVTYKKKLEP